MSTFTHKSMINHHGQSLLGQLAETFHVWRQRYAARRELAKWSDRELHDIGVSRAMPSTRPQSHSGGPKTAARPASPHQGDAGHFFRDQGSVR